MLPTKTIRLLLQSLILTFLVLICQSSFGQSRIDSLLGKLDPQRYATVVEKKAKGLEDKLLKKSTKVLNKLQQREEKIYRKLLSSKDSIAARLRLQECKSRYSALRERLQNPLKNVSVPYIAKLDSLNTSLKFLEGFEDGEKVKEALAATKGLSEKFSQAELIKKFIKERRQHLKEHLEKLGSVKDLKKINKQIYYYSAQVNEYKEILKDPKKIEKKVFELLAKNKWFQGFMRKNSILASLFRVPGDPADPVYLASLSGLQTSAQVNTLIQQQIQSAGPGGSLQLQQQMQNVQNEISQLRDKISKFGGESSDDIIPEGFRPNEQKTKSFLKRLELGSNIQTQKATSFFPNISEVALSVGYKLNDKSLLGIGGGAKIGLGRGWNNIRFSYEGISLRSFIDWKLKGNLWICGAFEMSYKTSFDDFVQLKNMNGWQRSGLIGLSKSMPVKSKFFKKTKLQLLWDFLSYKQRPQTQAVIFRIGYSF